MKQTGLGLLDFTIQSPAMVSDTKPESLHSILNSQAQELTELRTKIILLESQVQLLQSLVKLSLPVPQAATQAINISEQKIRDVAEQLKDNESRAHRLILWGKFPKTNTPLDAAIGILSQLSQPKIPNPSNCSWLTGKHKKKVLGIMVTFCSPQTVFDCVQQTDTIKKTANYVTGVSQDKPLHARAANTGKGKGKLSKLEMIPVVDITRLEKRDLAPETSKDVRPPVGTVPLASSSPTIHSVRKSLAPGSPPKTPGTQKPVVLQQTRLATARMAKWTNRTGRQGLLGSPPIPLRTKLPSSMKPNQQLTTMTQIAGHAMNTRFSKKPHFLMNPSKPRPPDNAKARYPRRPPPPTPGIAPLMPPQHPQPLLYPGYPLLSPSHLVPFLLLSLLNRP